MHPFTTRAWWLVGFTPVIMWLTHYLAVLPHEFAHSIVAWIVGIKPVPGDITWGGTSLWNIMLLAHVDEHVDYQAAIAAGKDWQAAAAALAGPVIGNGLPYLIVRNLIFRGRFLTSHPVLLYVVFWYLFFGVANLYDYVPTRVFADDGDITHFVEGSHANRWWIYAIGTSLVLWAIVDLYRTVLPRVLGYCGFGDLPIARALVLLGVTATCFGYFAIPALEETDPVTLFIGRTSLLLIPVVLVVTWRRGVLDALPTAPVHAPASPARSEVDPVPEPTTR
jgi:hypothetical protein